MTLGSPGRGPALEKRARDRYTGSMQCPLCRRRPARRACPAKGVQICSVCCGTLRQKEIACPPDCAYLAASQAHPAAAVRRQQERDRALVALLTDGLTERQVGLCSALLSVVAGFRSDPLFRLTDADVADASASLAATLETSGRGVIYEHRPASLVAQRLSADLKNMLAGAGVQNSRLLEQDAAVILRRLEVAMREIGGHMGLGPTAGVEIVGRVFRESAAAGARGPTPAAPAPPSLLIRP